MLFFLFFPLLSELFAEDNFDLTLELELFLFIGSHLGFDFPGSWLHIDMAAPAHMVSKLMSVQQQLVKFCL